MSKQDRQGVRSARDLEQKYDFSSLVKDKGHQSQEEELRKLAQSFAQYQAKTNDEIDSLKNTSYTKTEIDNMFGIYVDEIDLLIGGGDSE